MGIGDLQEIRTANLDDALRSSVQEIEVSGIIEDDFVYIIMYPWWILEVVEIAVKAEDGTFWCHVSINDATAPVDFEVAGGSGAQVDTNGRIYADSGDANIYRSTETDTSSQGTNWVPVGAPVKLHFDEISPDLGSTGEVKAIISVLMRRKKAWSDEA